MFSSSFLRQKADYVHNKVADGLGKIGVLVGLESAGDAAKLQAFGRQLAMHVAAAAPLALTADELDQDVIAKERAIYVEQAQASGKPQEIIEKMVDGKIKKFINEVCFLGQPFVKDPEIKIATLLKEKNAKIHAFKRFEVGEGIEKKQEDFAAEVMAQVKG